MDTSNRWGIVRTAGCVLLLLLLLTPAQKIILEHLGMAVFALPFWAALEIKTTFFPGQLEPKE